MTLEDVKNSQDDKSLIENASKYIKEQYQWLDDYHAQIMWNKYEYDHGPVYIAKVRDGYHWSTHNKTLKDAVMETIEDYKGERDRCRQFLDDIDDDYDD